MNRVFSCVYSVLKYTTPVSCRGVACYARNSAQRAAYFSSVCSVNHHGAPKARVAGVARYAPTEEGKRLSRWVIEDYLGKADE